MHNYEFTKILLLSETHRRPIRDPSDTYRRPIGDPSETSTWFIGDRHAKPVTHQRPRHASLETDMPNQRPIEDRLS